MENNQTKRKRAGGVHALQYHFVWCPKHRRGALTGLPCLWSRSYYVGSVGQVSDETVRRYIEAQKGV